MNRQIVVISSIIIVLAIVVIIFSITGCPGGSGGTTPGNGNGSSNGTGEDFTPFVPEDPQLIAENNRGVGLMGQFNFAEAHEVFAQLAEKHPNWLDVRVNLAIATLNRQEEGDEAEALNILGPDGNASVNCAMGLKRSARFLASARCSTPATDGGTAGRRLVIGGASTARCW